MNKMTMDNKPRAARINVRVKGPMADYLETMIGPDGLYENQSEYIRDLIRHDMADHPPYDLESGLREGYTQLIAGDYDDQPFDEIMANIKQGALAK